MTAEPEKFAAKSLQRLFHRTTYALLNTNIPASTRNRFEEEAAAWTREVNEAGTEMRDAFRAWSNVDPPYLEYFGALVDTDDLQWQEWLRRSDAILLDLKGILRSGAGEAARVILVATTDRSTHTGPARWRSADVLRERFPSRLAQLDSRRFKVEEDLASLAEEVMRGAASADTDRARQPIAAMAAPNGPKTVYKPSQRATVASRSPLPLFVTEESIGRNSSRYVLRPIANGLGTPLAEAIRQALLSEVLTPTITEVRFDGEWLGERLLGVRDSPQSVADRAGALRISSEKSYGFTMEVRSGQRGRLTGADLVGPLGTAVLNTEQELMTLDGTSDVVLQVAVEFEPTVDTAQLSRQRALSGIAGASGPVRVVHYEVSDFGRGGLEQLTFDIETDGAVRTSEALYTAVKYLGGFFSHASMNINRPRR